MKKINLDRKRFEFTIDGKAYEVKSPTLKMVKEYTKKTKDSEDSIEDAMSFLETLGMPREVTEALELAHLEIVIEEVTGQKKN